MNNTAETKRYKSEQLYEIHQFDHYGIFCRYIGLILRLGVGSAFTISNGPGLVSTLFAIFRTGFSVPEEIKQISFILIGIIMGSNFTPEALLSISRWPSGILIMILSVITIIFLCKLILHNFFGMDRKSSLLASTPGHLSLVLMLGTETEADITKIAIIQSIRVLALTIITPVIVVLYGETELNDANLQREIMNSDSLVVLCLLSIISGLLLKASNFPAPFLIGAMLISALSHGANLTPGYVPILLEGIAFATLGTVIGPRFVGVELESLKSCLISGLKITLARISICFLATFIIYK